MIPLSKTFFFLLVSLLTSCSSWRFKTTMVKKLIGNVFTSCCMLTAFPYHSLAEDSIRSVKEIEISYDSVKKPIESYLGKAATLIVNINTQCDLPSDGEPQCQDLVNLYKNHKNEGFQILAFPSEQFRDRSMMGEPEPAFEIRESFRKQYGWEFPIFDFVDVNGGNTAEIFRVMKDIKSINPSDLKKINWNYEKFLLNKDGVPVRRYRPSVLPSQLEGDVNDLIKTGKLKPRAKVALGAV